MSQHVYNKLVEGFKDKYNLEIEDVLKNYKYCGGDSDEHLSKWKLYWDNKTIKLSPPPHTNECVCDHHIERQCYITNGIEVIVVGSCCINNFLNRCILNCERCDAPHKNRIINLCNECKKDPYECKLCKHQHHNHRNIEYCKPCLKANPNSCRMCGSPCVNTMCLECLKRYTKCFSCYNIFSSNGNIYCSDQCKPNCVVCDIKHTNKGDYCSLICSSKTKCWTCEKYSDSHSIFCSEECKPKCLVCKTPMTHRSTYCSTKCSNTKYCFKCNNAFLSDKPTSYCSEECKPSCIQCSRRFAIGFVLNRNYCSEYCYRHINCETCGKKYYAFNGLDGFCSVECQPNCITCDKKYSGIINDYCSTICSYSKKCGNVNCKRLVNKDTLFCSTKCSNYKSTIKGIKPINQLFKRY